MPFDNASFDVAYMLHVGMNIEVKSELFADIARVLASGGRFAVYDVMRTGDGDIIYPVPWATNGETSFLASPSEYRSALVDAGLNIDGGEKSARQSGRVLSQAPRQGRERGRTPTARHPHSDG